ncbi:hypothetical protein FKP32DRAFT_1592096 [Trametes sanguinea]|nr:hypothetical protein FKP32DRAFT_1592096 [Trametes sanguinea]
MGSYACTSANGRPACADALACLYGRTIQERTYRPSAEAVSSDAVSEPPRCPIKRSIPACPPCAFAEKVGRVNGGRRRGLEDAQSVSRWGTQIARVDVERCNQTQFRSKSTHRPRKTRGSDDCDQAAGPVLYRRPECGIEFDHAASSHWSDGGGMWWQNVNVVNMLRSGSSFGPRRRL